MGADVSESKTEAKKPGALRAPTFRRVKMVEYVAPAGRGGSDARILGSEDDTKYIVKFKENRQGIRVLVNELVANGIAQLLDLPCPEGVIAVIDSQFLQASNIGNVGGKQVSEGQHYGTAMLETPYQEPPASLIGGVENKKDFATIVLFDILVMNTNRHNRGNYLVVRGEENKPRFCIIDHGHCFGSPQWDVTIRTKIEEPGRPALPQIADCIKGRDPFAQALARIQALTVEQIKTIIQQVPDEWAITDEEREALADFLSGRKDRVSEIIAKQKGHFRGWQ